MLILPENETLVLKVTNTKVFVTYKANKQIQINQKSWKLMRLWAAYKSIIKFHPADSGNGFLLFYPSFSRNNSG